MVSESISPRFTSNVNCPLPESVISAALLTSPTVVLSEYFLSMRTGDDGEAAKEYTSCSEPPRCGPAPNDRRRMGTRDCWMEISLSTCQLAWGCSGNGSNT